MKLSIGRRVQLAVRTARSLLSEKRSGTPFVFPTWGMGDLGIPTLIDYLTYADEGYGKNAVVHGCVREISRSAPSARIIIKRRLSNSQTENWEKHPLQTVLDKPNENQSQVDFVELFYTYLNIDGNAFIIRERPGKKTVAMWLPRPDRMRPVIKDRALIGFVYVAETGERIPWLPEEIIHIKEPNPSDPYEGLGRGLAPLSAAAVEADVDNRATRFMKMFFDNAAVPFGLLKSKNILSDGEVKRIRARIKSQFAGERNWHELMILDADADYQRMGLNLTEMEFPSLRAISETRICAVFKVPPILVGIKAGLDASTYSNYTQARRAMWEDKIIPDNNKLAAKLTASFKDELGSDGVIAHDYSNVVALQEDRTNRFNRANQGVNGGWITVNEARREVGLAPVGGGDVFLRPLMSLATPTPGSAGDLAAPKQLPAGPTVKMLKGANHTGVMVAFFLPEEDAQRLALSAAQLPEGSLPAPAAELHVTLAYLGEATDVTVDQAAIAAVVRHYATQWLPIAGRINGIGRFTTDDGAGRTPVYANFDAPELSRFRQGLVDALGAIGVAPEGSHGFTPHITLAYVPETAPTPEISLGITQTRFDQLALAWGGEVAAYALRQPQPKANWDAWGAMIHKSVDRIARAWELRYLQAGKDRFTEERREVEALIRQVKGTKATIDYSRILRELAGYVDATAEADWASRFEPLMIGMLEDQAENWAVQLGIQWNLQNPEVRAFIHQYAYRFAAQIGSTTKGGLATVLELAQVEQWSITKLIGEVGGLYDGWSFQRAEMIARSETIRASNAGAAEAYRAAGVTQKQWYAALDERTCAFCGHMHEVIVGVEANFFNKGDTLAIGLPDGTAAADLLLEYRQVSPDRWEWNGFDVTLDHKTQSLTLIMGYDDVGYPPLHPNCRCTILPVIAEA